MQPLASVATAILEGVGAFAVHTPLLELAFVHAAVGVCPIPSLSPNAY